MANIISASLVKSFIRFILSPTDMFNVEYNRIGRVPAFICCFSLSVTVSGICTISVLFVLTQKGTAVTLKHFTLLISFLPLGKIYEDLSYERMRVNESSQNNQINSFKAPARFSSRSEALMCGTKEPSASSFLIKEKRVHVYQSFFVHANRFISVKYFTRSP